MKPPVWIALAGTLAVCCGPEPELLELRKGDCICLLGNGLAERMQHDGWLETRLQSRFPELGLTMRNLGFAGDELSVQQRTMNFGKFSYDQLMADVGSEPFAAWDRYLAHLGADVIFAFFGYNESFAGSEGLAKFRKDLENFVRHVSARKYNAESAPRLVLFSPIPHEDLRDPKLPNGREHNARLMLYTRAMADVAKKLNTPFVDLFTAMLERYKSAMQALTINGMHLNDTGNRVLAEVIDRALFAGGRSKPPAGRAGELRRAVLDKNLLWFNRYRVTDGYNVYGGRSRERYPRRKGTPDEARVSNFRVLQREMDVLDVMVQNRDRRIRALARGEELAVDDSNVPQLIEVRTDTPGEGPRGRHVFLSGAAAIQMMTAAKGMRVELYASERQFPELVNPVQMAWDTQGRLWVAAWPTYPHWKPGQPRNDKLLILEDQDADGRADACKVFAGDLQNPTGFEFWTGGVLVASAPDLLFLKDSDGDDVADTRERLLHGLSSADTHHSANSFVLGPGGALYFQEGTFHRSQIESIYGPVRNLGG
ncbi:MAG: PVC-type heme-binding CxxCH protein, partial [Planctomycetota bacterium]